MRGDLQLCALTDCNCGDRHFLYLGQHSPDALPLRPDVSMWRRLTERVVLSVIVLAALIAVGVTSSAGNTHRAQAPRGL